MKLNEKRIQRICWAVAFVIGICASVSILTSKRYAQDSAGVDQKLSPSIRLMWKSNASAEPEREIITELLQEAENLIRLDREGRQRAGQRVYNYGMSQPTHSERRRAAAELLLQSAYDEPDTRTRKMFASWIRRLGYRVNVEYLVRHTRVGEREKTTIEPRFSVEESYEVARPESPNRNEKPAPDPEPSPEVAEQPTEDEQPKAEPKPRKRLALRDLGVWDPANPDHNPHTSLYVESRKAYRDRLEREKLARLERERAHQAKKLDVHAREQELNTMLAADSQSRKYGSHFKKGEYRRVSVHRASSGCGMSNCCDHILTTSDAEYLLKHNPMRFWNIVHTYRKLCFLPHCPRGIRCGSCRG